jgi:hypothetical protein
MKMSSSVSLVFLVFGFFPFIYEDAGNKGSEAGEKSERLMEKK